MDDYVYMGTKQIVECGKYPFTMSQLRNYIHNSNENGLYVCIRKVGKRLLFRADLFEKWIEDHQVEFLLRKKRKR